MLKSLVSSHKSRIAKAAQKILCFWANTTNQIQVIRIKNVPTGELEQIVFPGQRLMFETVAEAKLEIVTTEKGEQIHTDVISCHQLRIHEKVG